MCFVHFSSNACRCSHLSWLSFRKGPLGVWLLRRVQDVAWLHAPPSWLNRIALWQRMRLIIAVRGGNFLEASFVEISRLQTFFRFNFFVLFSVKNLLNHKLLIPPYILYGRFLPCMRIYNWLIRKLMNKDLPDSLEPLSLAPKTKERGL